jgi:hypothetical protein
VPPLLEQERGVVAAALEGLLGQQSEVAFADGAHLSVVSPGVITVRAEG